MLRTETALALARPPVLPVTDRAIAAHGTLWAALGLVAAVLGAAAIGFAATPFVEPLLGALLLADALAKGVHAVHLRAYRGSVWRISAAATAVTAGALLIALPAAGVLSLTLVVGVFLVVSGLAKGFLALTLEPGSSWNLLLGNSIACAGLGLGVLLWVPAEQTWAVALILGLAFLLDGLWLIVTSWTARGRVAARHPR